jgi:hypothetical protein
VPEFAYSSAIAIAEAIRGREVSSSHSVSWPDLTARNIWPGDWNCRPLDEIRSERTVSPRGSTIRSVVPNKMWVSCWRKRPRPSRPAA